jgi:acetyltransferase-like isoleucine patch superfamily enzyme
MRILVEEDNNIIEIGEHVIINASKIQPTVITLLGGRRITIGDNALFSNNIEIHATDYHGVYDKNGRLINENRDIEIGKHVWVGLGCKIMKGTVIKDGSIVGTGSLVAGKFEEGNVVLAGNPAKIIRHQVFWDADRKPQCHIPDHLKEEWEEIC